MEVENVEAGEFVNIDEYVEQLKKDGYDIFKYLTINYSEFKTVMPW